MKQQQKKLGYVILGSLIMGIGISMTIIANVGSDPMSVFWIGISDTLSISVGQANLLVCSCILLVVLFVDRKQLHIGSLINPICISLVTDMIVSLSITVEHYMIRVMLCVIGLCILAFGIALYALADMGKGAYEALVFCIQKKSKYSIRAIRITCDLTLAIFGYLLGGPVALGTLLAILCIGTGIQFFIRYLSKKELRL